MKLEQFDAQNKSELSMIEVAYAILQRSGELTSYNNLLLAVQDFLEFSEAELEAKMVRFYTELNIDGRFISLGDNVWGLRAWYGVDEIDEEIISSLDDEDLPQRRRAKKSTAFATDGEMIDYNADDPEDHDEDYDEDDFYEDDEDMDSMSTEPEDDGEEEQELDAYESDLDELGEEEIEELDEDDDTYLDDESDEDEDEE